MISTGCIVVEAPVSYDLKLTYEEEGGIVCAHARGRIDYHGRIEMWKSIAEFCGRHECHNLLIEADLTPLPTIQAYEYSKIFEAAGIDDTYRLAIVVRNPEALESIEFLDMVLKSKGRQVSNVFKDVARARNWLKRSGKTR